MEKRRHQRMLVNSLQVDIYDGQGFFSGTVADLSRFGLKLDDVPKKLDEKAKRFSIIVSGHGQHFKMQARSRWVQRKSLSKKVGLEIINAPWGWTEFVMKLEPALGDVWGEVTI